MADGPRSRPPREPASSPRTEWSRRAVPLRRAARRTAPARARRARPRSMRCRTRARRTSIDHPLRSTPRCLSRGRHPMLRNTPRRRLRSVRRGIARRAGQRRSIRHGRSPSISPAPSRSRSRSRSRSDQRHTISPPRLPRRRTTSLPRRRTTSPPRRRTTSLRRPPRVVSATQAMRRRGRSAAADRSGLPTTTATADAASSFRQPVDRISSSSLSR